MVARLLALKVLTAPVMHLTASHGILAGPSGTQPAQTIVV